MNTLITNILPYLPKWFSKPFAKPYVAGETIDTAIAQVKLLNQKGFSATLDILGEHVKSKDTAENITRQYCKLYHHINDNLLDCTLSVKPTHVGLMISQNEAILNMSTIAQNAKKYGNFLRIDMESSQYTNQTFEIFNNCRLITKNVGVAIQAYLFRSLDDIEKMANNHFNSRICKGIYKESNLIAFQDREDIKNNYLLMAKTMAVKGAFAGYATHDQDLIDRLLDWIKSEKISKHLFEFQVLFGVPMNGRLETLIEKGYKVRIYVPFGPDWFEYSVRRLKENPNIAKYVLSNLIKNR